MGKKHRLDGFQKRIDAGERKNVKIAVIRQGETDKGFAYAECSCGQPFTHQRKKARENSIQRHLDKKHGGRGLWL